MIKSNSLLWYGVVSFVITFINLAYQYLFGIIHLIDLILFIVGALIFIMGVIADEKEI